MAHRGYGAPPWFFLGPVTTKNPPSKPPTVPETSLKIWNMVVSCFAHPSEVSLIRLVGQTGIWEYLEGDRWILLGGHGGHGDKFEVYNQNQPQTYRN